VPERGRVYLVGAGPGDPELITVRGAKTLGLADVVLYDQLATDELLDLAPDRAERINVGKRGHDAPTRSQADINALIVEHALAGRTVVRLKGGDPFVFGRGGEEVSACAAAGIHFEVVPGVTSAIAALAYAGIPVTDRRHSASFAVVTGHKDPSAVAEQTRWRELGTAVDTVVIVMGMRNLPTLVQEMIDGGKSPDTPAAAIMHGTLPNQRSVVSTLAGLPEAVSEAGLGAPSVVVVGHVVKLRAGLSWWERQPLFGRRVLVTRAKEQAAEFGAALRSVGAAPVFVPMIELAAMSDPEGKRAVDKAIREIDETQAIVFTSSNAVRFFVRALEAQRGRRAGLSPGTQTFCVGDRTAEAALAAGLPVHVVATGRGDAENLLAQILKVLPVEGQRVLIPGSQIARTVIADGLRAAGGRVDAIPFYENRRPQIDCAALREELAQGRLYALTFTSPSTVDHFVECLDASSREAASQCMIAAIGRTTAERLEQLGFAPEVVPDRPDVSAMVQGLVERAAGRV
jgi:uroporphyrinogen III methyltransferase/synthase